MATTKIRDIGEPTIRVQGDRVHIHIPMRFKKKSGRKEIIFADPTQAEKAVNDQVQVPLVIALARAHRWMERLEDGTFGSIAELAEAVELDPSRVRRLLNLTLLPPLKIGQILAGLEEDDISLDMLLQSVGAVWSQ